MPDQALENQYWENVMVSDTCSRAIENALHHKKALLKFISANDAGSTGGHQSGFYLPKDNWRLFAPMGPIRGRTDKHYVVITWHDGVVTESVITWYGDKTRSEYRLTRVSGRLSRRFEDHVGDLLVLVPTSPKAFDAFVLRGDDDIAEIQSVLGSEITKSWAVYDEGAAAPETEDDCLRREFDELVSKYRQLPKGAVFSKATLDALKVCVPAFGKDGIDGQLLRLVREEYNLYRMAERKVFQKDITKRFTSIDAFVKTAQSILQTRKTRAGRSLENHVQHILEQHRIPFEMRKKLDNTSTDIIIPSKKNYDDPLYPQDRLIMVGVKTTCKDRWRQVLKEAPRISAKHILTLQKGITANQMDEMERSNVTLVVPESLHEVYPKGRRDRILSVDEFITQVKATLGSA